MSSSSNFTEIVANVFAELADTQELDPTAQYGYIPTRAVCYIFVALFGISTLAHLFQGLYYRMWWTIPTIILAGCLETLGWSGRLWSSFSPLLSDPYMIQIVSTIIGPTPLVAANFIILGSIIQILGPVYSRLSPRNYSRIFLTCDIISLVVQGAGGGIAASFTDIDAINSGGHIMLGGIVFQLVIIVLYMILATEFFFRYFQDRPIRGDPGNQSQDTLHADFRGDLDPKLKAMVCALAFNIVCLFIRSIYRTIELADGWNGTVIKTQVYFNVLDGAMIILAIYTLNFAHPGYLIGRDMGKSVEALRKDSRSSEDFGMAMMNRV